MDLAVYLSLAYLLAFVLSVVLFGWIGGACGVSRGRKTAGMWLGILLGPIGCIIALFLPRVEPVTNPQTS